MKTTQLIAKLRVLSYRLGEDDAKTVAQSVDCLSKMQCALAQATCAIKKAHNTADSLERDLAEAEWE